MKKITGVNLPVLGVLVACFTLPALAVGLFVGALFVEFGSAEAQQPSPLTIRWFCFAMDADGEFVYTATVGSQSRATAEAYARGQAEAGGFTTGVVSCGGEYEQRALRLFAALAHTHDDYATAGHTHGSVPAAPGHTHGGSTSPPPDGGTPDGEQPEAEATAEATAPDGGTPDGEQPEAEPTPEEPERLFTWECRWSGSYYEDGGDGDIEHSRNVVTRHDAPGRSGAAESLHLDFVAGWLGPIERTEEITCWLP